VEGCDGKQVKDKVNFYDAARGALAESKKPLIDGEGARYFQQLACAKLTTLSGYILNELCHLLNIFHKVMQA